MARSSTTSQPTAIRPSTVSRRPRAGDGDPLDGEELRHREVEPDPEHQEHHPDLGELPREAEVADEAGGRRADRHPRDEVPDERRDLQLRGDEAEDEREAEARGDRGDEAYVVRHGSPLQAGG